MQQATIKSYSEFYHRDKRRAKTLKQYPLSLDTAITRLTNFVDSCQLDTTITKQTQEQLRGCVASLEEVKENFDQEDLIVRLGIKRNRPQEVGNFPSAIVENQLINSQFQPASSPEPNIDNEQITSDKPKNKKRKRDKYYNQQITPLHIQQFNPSSSSVPNFNSQETNLERPKKKKRKKEKEMEQKSKPQIITID
eukprot:TRINITY_DN724_c0_g2_i2.p4 TRINITY_DN724_c0_g2~~TRINITY_DN724_c0_g2_i2.p4  ORF type:complete len:195 (-),score=10.81 TRINITY_DN724_c0_g2_i2:1126-1710(-)